MGKNHPRWNNGETISHGYTRINVGKQHPLSDPNGYAYLHILMWVAAGNTRPELGDVVHHINGDKTDNRIENLKYMTSSDHISLHNAQRKTDGKVVKMPKLDGVVWDQYPEGK
jgi:hypothetical protein